MSILSLLRELFECVQWLLYTRIVLCQLKLLAQCSVVNSSAVDLDLLSTYDFETGS